MNVNKVIGLAFGILFSVSVLSQSKQVDYVIKVGAERTELYFPALQNKRVGVVANQTAIIGKKHLIDSLRQSGITIIRVFSPEHGFRGQAEAGEKVGNSYDRQTGLLVISLYGDKKKPAVSDLDSIDVMLFDLQDVGVRCYTYISTLYYIMEACALRNIPLIVLDRPNPHGYYIDGPVMETCCTSFVGLHIGVPLVHGMTVGEYARMIAGECWLPDSIGIDLTVIPVENYFHAFQYQLPVPPSPNLPNMEAVYFYPSLVLLEGTVMSIGRGTDFPFQQIGHPLFPDEGYSFVPRSIPGFAQNPPQKDKICYGYQINDFGSVYIRQSKKIYLFYLSGSYSLLKDKTNFFNNFFEKLAGNQLLRQQIINGVSEEEIRASWQPGIERFKQIRKKYLLYRDFE